MTPKDEDDLIEVLAEVLAFIEEQRKLNAAVVSSFQTIADTINKQSATILRLQKQMLMSHVGLA